MLTMVRSSRVMNTPRASTPRAAIGWWRIWLMVTNSLELLECEADEVDRGRDQDKEQAQTDGGRPAVPGSDDRVHLRVAVVFAFAHCASSSSLTALGVISSMISLTVLGLQASLTEDVEIATR